jgi:type II secretory pathway component PulK
MNELSPILISVVNAVLFVALPVLVVGVVAAIGAYARRQWEMFRTMRPDLASQLAMYARIAVEAAEQAGLAKLIEDKKQYAIEIVIRWLGTVGLNGIDVELIEAEIERQVRELHDRQKYHLTATRG